jgi:hypothetical protein
MAMDFSFTLSLAALDLLWEQLGLGTPVRIFEVPSVGETLDDRARLRQVVQADLGRRDLVRRGRLAAEVEEALVTLARFDRAIDAVGILEEGERQCVRLAATTRVAVRASKSDQTVSVDLFRPEGLVYEAVSLIGNLKPGPGQSVTYQEGGQEPTRRPPVPPAEGYGGVLQRARPERTGDDLAKRAAATIWERPRTRAGIYTVYGRDRFGREHTLPVLGWFDTEDGRYLAHTRPNQDGLLWTTYSPADSNRIGQQLNGMLNAVVPMQPPR